MEDREDGRGKRGIGGFIVPMIVVVGVGVVAAPWSDVIQDSVLIKITIYRHLLVPKADPTLDPAPSHFEHRFLLWLNINIFFFFR